jgi:hypothetical protein
MPFMKNVTLDLEKAPPVTKPHVFLAKIYTEST